MLECRGKVIIWKMIKLFFLNLCYWSIVNLRCVNFGCTVNWFRYICVCVSVKNWPAMRRPKVRSLGWENLLEKEMVTHSGILAWIISWTEEPGGLQPMGLQESDMTYRLTTTNIKNSRRWWRTGKPGVLHSMGGRVGHNWVTER